MSELRKTTMVQSKQTVRKRPITGKNFAKRILYVLKVFMGMLITEIVSQQNTSRLNFVKPKNTEFSDFFFNFLLITLNQNERSLNDFLQVSYSKLSLELLSGEAWHCLVRLLFT